MVFDFVISETYWFKQKVNEIDFVFLWCDGSDHNFIKQKNSRMRDLDQSWTQDNTGEIRYQQYDELRFALRSVYAFAPWFRYIYIVTNKQRPGWLKDHRKIKIIDHSEIIPSEFLPTFSSVCIEMFLDRIPGLAENFIYANDDMLLNKKLEPNDFFDKQGKPIVWLNRVTKILPVISDVEHQLQDDHDRSWYQTIRRAWFLFAKKNNLLVPCDSPAHSMDAYNIRILRSIVSKYPELLKANCNSFRTGQEISRVLYSYEMAYIHNCQLLFNNKPNFLNRMLSHLFNIKSYVVVRSNVNKLKRDIRLMNPQTFCINNLTDESSMAAIDFLNKKFPNSAPWERDNIC